MLNKLKNNNEGTITISRVIAYLILIIVIAFTLDILVVIAQNVVTSYEAAYYAEKVSIQGGLLGDQMLYPSINEAKGTNLNPICYDYKKPCTSCLKNSKINERISKTFSYFNVSNSEWDGFLEVNGYKTVFHSRLNQGAGLSNRKVLDYMSTATFVLSSQWEPIFARWLWPKEYYTIDKYVPIIIEYIPQVNLSIDECIAGWAM